MDQIKERSRHNVLSKLNQTKDRNRGSIDSVFEVMPEIDEIEDTSRGSIGSVQVMPKVEEIREKNRETIASIDEIIVNSKKVREASRELDKRISLVLKGYTFLMPPEYYEPILELEEPLINTEEPVIMNKKRVSAVSSEKKRSSSYKPVSMTEMLRKNLTANDDLQKKVPRSSVVVNKEEERFVLEDSKIVKKPLILEGAQQNHLSTRRRDTPRSIPTRRDGKNF